MCVFSMAVGELQEPTELPSGPAFELHTSRNFITKPTVTVNAVAETTKIVRIPITVLLCFTQGP
jgi:hypothetical protein